MGSTSSKVVENNQSIKIIIKYIFYKYDEDYNETEVKIPNVKTKLQKHLKKLNKYFKQVFNDYPEYEEYLTHYIYCDINKMNIKTNGTIEIFGILKYKKRKEKEITFNDYCDELKNMLAHTETAVGTEIEIDKSSLALKIVSITEEPKLSSKSTTKRKSPDVSATLFEVGTIDTGNDGNKWIVNKTKNGTKRWKILKT